MAEENTEELAEELIAQGLVQQQEWKIHDLQLQVRDAKKGQKAALKELKKSHERLDLALSIGAPVKPLKITVRSKRAKPREATAFALASDWHIEETVKPEQVNGRNEYNLDISSARSEKFFRGFEWLINFCSAAGDRGAGFTIRDAVLWLGGDLITGYIHEELMETNSLSPSEAILRCQEYICRGIDYVLERTQIERLIVPCSYGNHGRTTIKRKVTTGAHNSFEWLMYHALKMKYADHPKVDFIIADGAHLYLDVYDYTLRFHHGDDIRYWGGVGGLSVPLRKALDAWNEFKHADYTCIGHFHQYKDFGDSVCNGSLIGYNSYALSIKARYERPRQAFFLVDSERGKILSTPIWVEETDARI